MGKWLTENHTKLLWAVVAIIGFVVLLNTDSVGTLRAELDGQAEMLAQPQISAEILPGIPGDLLDEFQASSEGVGDPARSSHLWLTVALSNHGFAEADRVLADIEMRPEIAKSFALAHDGENTGEQWGGPQIAEPEEGETDDPSAVTVEFDSLPVNETHRVFLGLQPDGFEAPPYSAAERRRWAGEYRHALDRMTITAVGGDGDGATRTRVVYGFETMTTTPQADTTPATGDGQAPG